MLPLTASAFILSTIALPEEFTAAGWGVGLVCLLVAVSSAVRARRVDLDPPRGHDDR